MMCRALALLHNGPYPQCNGLAVVPLPVCKGYARGRLRDGGGRDGADFRAPRDQGRSEAEGVVDC